MSKMLDDPSTVKFDAYSITQVKISPPIQTDEAVNLFGVDPGTTHLGLAFVWRSVCHIFEIKIRRNPDPVKRIQITQEIMGKCFKLYEYSSKMVIEGSSFSSTFRQVELAEIRATAAIWGLEHNMHPSIIPPTKIRKVVFGGAEFRAEVEWDLKDYPNAASALACAYYSVKE